MVRACGRGAAGLRLQGAHERAAVGPHAAAHVIPAAGEPRAPQPHALRAAPARPPAGSRPVPLHPHAPPASTPPRPAPPRPEGLQRLLVPFPRCLPPTPRTREDEVGSHALCKQGNRPWRLAARTQALPLRSPLPTPASRAPPPSPRFLALLAHAHSSFKSLLKCYPLNVSSSTVPPSPNWPPNNMYLCDPAMKACPCPRPKLPARN